MLGYRKAGSVSDVGNPLLYNYRPHKNTPRVSLYTKHTQQMTAVELSGASWIA